MKYFFVAILLFLASCSTKNSLEPAQNDNRTTLPANYENQTVKTLSNIDKSYLPEKICDYFSGKDVNLLEFDRKVVFTKENTFASVLEFVPDDFNKFLIISGLEENDGKKFSFFYILRKTQDYWSNITPVVIPNEVLIALENEFQSQFGYTKDFRKDFYAYFFPVGDYYIDFCITNNMLTICKKNLNGDQKQIALLSWEEGSFHKYLKKQQQQTIKQIDFAPPVSDEELESKPRFTNLDLAFQNVENVYILDLSGQGLDSLTANIKYLKRLQILILDDNFLTELPESICQLKNLQVLRVNNNNLKELPSDIGNLTLLQELSAGDNQLTYLPTSLSALKNLEQLNLQNNQLTTLLVNFKDMSNLISLNISGNQITQLPSSLRFAVNLQSLDISDNPVKVLPKYIYTLKQLNYINLSGTKVPNDQIEELINTFPDAIINFE